MQKAKRCTMKAAFIRTMCPVFLFFCAALPTRLKRAAGMQGSALPAVIPAVQHSVH
jgi:hypothetical protein